MFGELHRPENHLVPTVVTKAIFNKRINVFGNNYDTPDKTAIRDFIHVKDICIAIEKSIMLIIRKNCKITINLGTEKGYSIKNIISKTSKFLKKKNSI